MNHFLGAYFHTLRDTVQTYVTHRTFVPQQQVFWFEVSVCDVLDDDISV